MQVHEKSVIVNAPVHEVFEMWRNWEDFPKYMHHIKRVSRLDDNLWHWEGNVGGMDEKWDARTTEVVPDRAIGWESVSGFKTRGEIRFDDVEGRTKVTVHFEYEPPVGVAGRAVDAIYMGKQFDRSLEHDLGDFKSQVEIEQGD